MLVVLAAGMAKRYGGCKPLAPLGLHGEAVIDLIAGDAVAAGFGDIVLVLGPQTGPAIRYHVRRCFPSRLGVSFAEQRVPLGTAHAVLCARKHVGDGPFAVVNADDVYGAPAMALLAGQLAEGDEHAIVSYRLRDTIVADAPVTRGTCEVGPDGHLRAPGGTARRDAPRRRGLRRRRRPRAGRAARRHPGVDEPVGVPALDLARARGGRARAPTRRCRPTAPCPSRPPSPATPRCSCPRWWAT